MSEKEKNQEMSEAFDKLYSGDVAPGLDADNPFYKCYFCQQQGNEGRWIYAIGRFGLCKDCAGHMARAVDAARMQEDMGLLMLHAKEITRYAEKVLAHYRKLCQQSKTTVNPDAAKLHLALDKTKEIPA